VEGKRPRLWIPAIWSAIAIVNATQVFVGMRAENMHHNWLVVFGYYQLLWLMWTVSTPVVIRLGRRYPPAWPPDWTGMFWHAALCTMLAAIYAAWETALLRTMNPYAPFRSDITPFVPMATTLFYRNSYANLTTYAAIVAIAHALDSRDRLAQREQDAARLGALLSEAQLNALRKQIEPHFLFNAMNGIAGLVRAGYNDRAVAMLAGLSVLLRSLLHASEAQMSSLGEEMERMSQYMEIQQMRFADRLQFEMDIPEELWSIPVPALVLQPVLENAIEHGINKRAGRGAISIRASRITNVLTVVIHNEGPLLASNWETSSGIGVRNTRARLKHLYGTEAAFELQNCANGTSGVDAIFRIPAPVENMIAR
jgi:two-component system LytT family sensor kinase